ncbi:MAG: lmo0937 family membrane protein [Patescibacteria group bacterium]
MLTTIAIVLIILWAVGFIGFHVIGGFIHLLLVIAVIMILIRLIRGENPLR